MIIDDALIEEGEESEAGSIQAGQSGIIADNVPENIAENDDIGKKPIIKSSRPTTCSSWL